MTGRSRVAGLLAVLLGLSGCASLSRPDADAWQGADPELSACATWMEALDQAVAAAGVRDAQEVRLRGFPHLRASRLSDALRTQASRGPAAMADWVGLLQRQGRAGQTVELANLPAPVLTRWMAVADGELAREQARRRLNDCSDRLAAAVLAEPGATGPTAGCRPGARRLQHGSPLGGCLSAQPSALQLGCAALAGRDPRDVRP
jgi:hypothetical protein